MTTLSRRAFLSTMAACAVGRVIPVMATAPLARSDWYLKAETTGAALVGANYPATPVWAYNGRVPGPLIRVRQGERLRVTLDNALSQASTIHWHGIRLPNAMDGVPHLTQEPVAPGEQFVYEFEPPDAGTYWYHPHANSAEQLGRGLYGALIIEEPEPITVDRELVWVLDDWRLTREAAISDDFNHPHDISHNGRLGNTVTVNGEIPETVAVQAGERIRLRLINAANARIFGLRFTGHQPTIIAVDGQPVTPHEPEDGRLVLGPAMRMDVILDASGEVGQQYSVHDEFYSRQTYRLLDLVYDDVPLREQLRDDPIALPANPLGEPDMSQAESLQVLLEGGAMGGMKEATLGGEPMTMRELVSHGAFWALNGVAMLEHGQEPLFTLQRGRSYRITLENPSAWHHPMHLHGHHFRVLSRNGEAVPHRPWQDTVLVPPREQVEIALLADNPGDWMFHCHILEHQYAGMMAVIRVT